MTFGEKDGTLTDDSLYAWNFFSLICMSMTLWNVNFNKISNTLKKKKVISLYVYHPDIKSGNKVPSDGFIVLLKLICSRMNLFFLLT